MRIIALEEHIATPAYHEKIGARPRAPTLLRRQQEHGHDVVAELMNIGESRLKYMDEAGISLQVLSLTMPGIQAFAPDVAVPLARDTNDLMAEAIKKHPARFAGFASLATCAPAEAAKELERCVTKLGFKGTMINGHAQGSYLDDKKYWGLFEAAQALDVPIYLHPREPHPAVLKAYSRTIRSCRLQPGASRWRPALISCGSSLPACSTPIRGSNSSSATWARACRSGSTGSRTIRGSAWRRAA